jgi:hypothetical protein
MNNEYVNLNEIPLFKMNIAMEAKTFWLLPQSEGEINSSFELSAFIAQDETRSVRVRLGRDVGTHTIDATGMRQKWALEYEHEGLSVMCLYFFSRTKYKYLELNGETRESTCPSHFAIPLDIALRAYGNEFQRSLGNAPAQAQIDQFVKDIADALRLYSRQRMGVAVLDEGKKLDSKVFGFNGFEIKGGKEILVNETVDKKALEVLKKIEVEGY